MMRMILSIMNSYLDYNKPGKVRGKVHELSEGLRGLRSHKIPLIG